MLNNAIMLDFKRLARTIQDEIGRKENFSIEIKKSVHYGSTPDPLECRISISLGGQSVSGVNPEDVFTEVMRRVGWQRRQDSIQLSSPSRPEAVDVEVEASAPSPRSQAVDDDIPF